MTTESTGHVPSMLKSLLNFYSSSGKNQAIRGKILPQDEARNEQ